MDKPISEAVDVDAILARHLPSKYWDRAKAAFSALTAAQQQGQAVAWVPVHPRQGPLWAMATDKPDRERLPSYPLRPLIYGDTAAPPSAPVGVPVDVVREYLDARACYEAATRRPNSHAPAPVLKHGDPVVLRLRDARVTLDNAIALAQQPAQSAPVGDDETARRVLDRWYTHQAGVNMVNRYWTDAQVSAMTLALRDALAQQPAAVDSEPDCPHSALDGCDCYATQHQEPTT